MKLNKTLIKISIIFSILTLFISFILVLFNLCRNSDMINYLINVLLAIFGSSAIMLFTSVWGYFSERKKCELQYATFARNFLLRTVRFLNQINNKPSDPHEVYIISGDLHSLYDSFAYEKNFEIYGYFLKNGKRKIHMERIHGMVHELSRELSDIEFLSQKAFHNKETDFIYTTNIDISKLDGMHDMISQTFRL